MALAKERSSMRRCKVETFTEGNRPMKITNIRCIVVNAEMRNWIFVKVETDQDGLWGWGEATVEWKTRAVVGAIEDLVPLLLGRDPRRH